MNKFFIEDRPISNEDKVYFIADIAANHDGDIERAKDLIYSCAEAGADAAKFQHFTAETIVSDKGFKELGKQLSHQSKWEKTVFEVYQDASLNNDWNPILRETCDKAGINFFTSPYSHELVDKVDQFVSAYKIGSGDITWIDLISYISKKNKPVIIATGASTMKDVDLAMKTILKHNKNVVLMQCNTNYTASIENFNYINLNVLKTYKKEYPEVILGLSDHTPGHSTVLGSIALGAKVIEKHYTDNNNRIGPDHKFSMNPVSWREMVDRARELELALGIDTKIIEDNEIDTSILQRRCIRAKRNIEKDTLITINDIDVLRPCPENGLPPYESSNIIGKVLKKDLTKGDLILWKDLKQ